MGAVGQGGRLVCNLIWIDSRNPGNGHKDTESWAACKHIGPGGHGISEA